LSSAAPAWFVKALAIMDPLLSIRKSVVTSHWVIERKAIILGSEIETLRRRRDRMWRWINFPNDVQKEQLHANRKEWQSLADEVCSAEQQKRVICRPRWLDQEVYNSLCQSDFQRYGGAARYCTNLEQEEERLEAEQERILSNKRQALNAEVFDMLSFLHRKRGAALDQGHQDFKYLLHGRHTKEGDAPVVQLSDF
jgi:hypothetical protein